MAALVAPQIRLVFYALPILPPGQPYPGIGPTMKQKLK